MFYNHEKQFLFIHVQRTGGTSLLDHFYKTLSNDGQNYFQHTSLSYFQKKEQDAFAESFRFAFVRNPWDRFASWYALLKGSGIAEQYGSFEEELYKATVYAHETRMMSRFPICQLELLKDIEGKVNMDFIGRFENYQQDAEYILSSLGLSAEGLEQINAAKQGHYSTFYTPESQSLIAEYCRPDIEYFGYVFDQK